MTPIELIDLLSGTTGIREGGTEHGMSADIRATTCGMMEAFSKAVPRQPMQIPQRFTDARGKGIVIGNRAGSVFHALQELWRTRPAAVVILPTPEEFDGIDESVGAAVMAFNRYREQNHSNMSYLGWTRGVEWAIEGDIAGQHRTGRIDQVVEADQEQVDRWCDYGILTANPGLYLWDYKLLANVSPDDAAPYQRSMQAIAYMHLYEKQTGVRPEGFIYELVSRAKNPGSKGGAGVSRLLVLVPNTQDTVEILEDFVQLAARRRAEAEADPTKCDSQYGTCPFISVCPRKGNAERHKDIIANHALLKTVRLDEAA